MLLDVLEQTGQLDDTCILFLGDNGYFFGEHGLGPERRFAYEEGIRSPFLVRYPPLVQGGDASRRRWCWRSTSRPRMIALAGGKPGPHVQGRSLVPLLARPAPGRLAQVVPRRVLERERDALAGGDDLQGGAHRAGTS